MPTKERLVTLIPIRKMDRAIEFYTKALGAKFLYRGEGEMADGWAGLELLGHDLWLVAPEKREKRELAYTTILVRNIRKTVARMQKAGVKFQKAERNSKDDKIEGPILFAPFGGMATFKDSEGNLLMVWENIPPM